MARPLGSKTKKRNAYAGRADRVREKHGKRCYRRWGKRGGNPALLKDKEPERTLASNGLFVKQRLPLEFTEC